MFGDFVKGAGYFLKGFSLVRTPGLRRFVFMPLVINIVVFSVAIWFGIGQFDILLDWILPGGDSWLTEFARVMLWVFFAAATLVILFFTFTVIANLVGAPFNGLLAEKVERHLTEGSPGGDGGIREFISSILPSIGSELRKLAYFLILASALLILTVMPGINVLSPLLWAFFSSWMLAVEYLAYPMENNRIYFRRARSMVRGRWALALGFGMAAMGMSLIPVVNFFIMPAAVAGATALWVEGFQKVRGDGERPWDGGGERGGKDRYSHPGGASEGPRL